MHASGFGRLPSLRRLLRAAQAGAFLAAVWLIWAQSAAYRAQGRSLSTLIGHAVSYELFAWSLVAAITLWLYLGASLAPFLELLFAALGSSAPAMWLVPAILLLSAQTDAGTAIGLVLVANTVRLLVSRKAPQRRGSPPPRVARSAPAPLFRHAGGLAASFPAQASRLILGAFAIEAGICAVWAEYPLLAAALIAGGAAIWTLTSIARGAYQPRAESNLPHFLLSISLTLLLLIGLPIGRLGAPEPVGDSGLLDMARRVFHGLSRASEPTIPVAKQSATPVFTPPKQIGKHGANGYPGAILRPEPQSGRTIWGGLRNAGAPVLLSQPYVIPFTGEYHLFPSSYLHLPDDWVMYRGTPLDGLYGTLNGGPLQTEAYQRLEPPVDFSNCGAVRLTLSSGELFPASATMQLLTAGRSEDLGPEIFGLDPASEETLEFAVPASLRHQVNAIRVVFHRNPAQRDKNARVAVRQFTLVPRV